jgi:hypothetical protein
MRLSLKILWLGVLSAVVAAGTIAFSRMAWEGEYRQAALAVDLSDLYGLPLDRMLKELQDRGLSALIVSAQDVEELRRRFFPKRPAERAIPLEELERIRALGFSLFWRLELWLPPEEFPRYLDVLFALKPRGLIISSPFAPAPPHWDLLLRRLLEHRALLGIVEFRSPVGVERLYRRGFRGFVRVHTIKREERAVLSDVEALARFRRAAVERNMRLLELRALTRSQILKDLETLQAELRRAGFSLGRLPEPAHFAAGPWALAGVWLGLVSLTALAMEKLIKPPIRRLMPFWLGVVLIGSVGLFVLEPARQAAAWIAAVAVPIAAFILLGERFRSGGSGLAFLAAISLSSILGGLMAAAFLSADLFALGIGGFRGVKAALILPILTIVLLAARRIEWHRVRALDTAIWAGVALLLAFVIMRSGNSFLSLWELEEWVRLRLEELLCVRPRFKEFIVGHPLMMLWASLGERRRCPWALALLALGFLGQVSIINSFLHLHTPLWVTLVRTFHGFWLGAALGGLLKLLLRAFDLRTSKR